MAIGIVLAILVHHALGVVVTLIGLALPIVPRLGAGATRAWAPSARIRGRWRPGSCR